MDAWAELSGDPIADLREMEASGQVTRARVKALSYQHLCYLPDFNGDPPGRIRRLDHVFGSPLMRGCDSARLRITEEVLEVIRAQFLVSCGFAATELLIALRELVATCLPAEISA